MVAAAEAPKTQGAIQFAILKEIRALRVTVEAQKGDVKVSPCTDKGPNRF